MKTYEEIVATLRSLNARGFIKTLRSGPTGIGKTLEELLGIEENNIPGPNAHMLELKSSRKNTGSMITLLTKSPDPPRVNSVLLDRFGYSMADGESEKILHSTVNSLEFNLLRGIKAFKIGIAEDRINLLTPPDEIVCYWLKDKLRRQFERKLPALLYVKADSRGTGRNEEFWYNEVWLLNGFLFEGFAELLRDQTILLDIRIGQYPNGKPHDHGTGFRVLPYKLDLCFSNRMRII